MSVRVIVIDELPLLRAGIAATLATMKSLQVVDSGTPTDAVRLAEHRRPDIMVIGLSNVDQALPAISSIAAQIAVKVVCLMPPGSESSVPMLMQARVSGCLMRSASPGELMRCLQTNIDGGQYVSPALAAAVLSRPVAKPRPVIPPQKITTNPLTKRETGILELVARGQSNRDIAHQLLLSEKTVKRYMTLIMHKINVRNRVQAALFLEKPGVAANAETSLETAG